MTAGEKDNLYRLLGELWSMLDDAKARLEEIQDEVEYLETEEG
jgi:hypothetical protein